jgi:hypothetical protein
LTGETALVPRRAWDNFDAGRDSKPFREAPALPRQFGAFDRFRKFTPPHPPDREPLALLRGHQGELEFAWEG